MTKEPHSQLGQAFVGPGILVLVGVEMDHVLELVGSYTQHVVTARIAVVGGQVDHVRFVAGPGLAPIGILVENPEKSVGRNIEPVIKQEDAILIIQGIGRITEVRCVQVPDALVRKIAHALVVEISDDAIDRSLVHTAHIPLVVIDDYEDVFTHSAHGAGFAGGHGHSAQVPDVPVPGVTQLRVLRY